MKPIRCATTRGCRLETRLPGLKSDQLVAHREGRDPFAALALRADRTSAARTEPRIGRDHGATGAARWHGRRGGKWSAPGLTRRRDGCQGQTLNELPDVVDICPSVVLLGDADEDSQHGQQNGEEENVTRDVRVRESGRQRVLGIAYDKSGRQDRKDQPERAHDNRRDASRALINLPRHRGRDHEHGGLSP